MKKKIFNSAKTGFILGTFIGQASVAIVKDSTALTVIFTSLSCIALFVFIFEIIGNVDIIEMIKKIDQ